MKRESVIFYQSFYEAIKSQSKKNQLKLYTALFEYALNGNETEMEPKLNGIFALMKPQIDANNKRYADGKKGGRPAKSTVPETEEAEGDALAAEKKAGAETEEKTGAISEPNQNEKENEKENGKENGKGNENLKGKEKEKEKGNGNGKEKETAPKGAGGDAGASVAAAPPQRVYDPLDERVDKAIHDFIAFRKSVAAPMTEQGISLMLEKLEELAENNNEKVAILEQSILNGWRGLFPLSGKKKEEKKHSGNDFLRMLEELDEEERKENTNG